MLKPILAAMVAAGLMGAPAWAADGGQRLHRLAIQVDQDDPMLMNLALNNAMNAIQEYDKRGERVDIEIVTYGPGLQMLRAESPVGLRIKSIHDSEPTITFSACGNTKAAMEKKEGREIALLPEARVVPAGVVRLMELQEQGWAYVRP